MSEQPEIPDYDEIPNEPDVHIDDPVEPEDYPGTETGPEQDDVEGD